MDQIKIKSIKQIKGVVNMKKYFMKVEAYARTESGKSWKSKPYKTYHEEIEDYNDEDNPYP